MDSLVPLNRQFLPVPKSQEEAESNEILSVWGHVKPKTWDDMYREFRCVILAEAGAGKTEELRHRASLIASQDKPAFFIRIEDIEADFYNAFEVGDEARFQSWLQSLEEAWFFLDSVDEARLDNPRNFEKALRRFTRGIKGGEHRAHIYLSSRPYAWRPREDRRLLDEILFLPAPKEIDDGDKVQKDEPQSALTIYTMEPLDAERIRLFCIARAAEDIDRLLREIDRANLWPLAERPFDLEGILAKWDEDKALGGRLELLRHNISKRLRDDHNCNRAQRQPLNLERAKEGARRLAAAVVLTGHPGLNVPDSEPVKPGIEAETVLADWNSPNDVRALLDRGIFNDVIYGMVRFRHRDVRELLAAEWFTGLLKTGNSRQMVESLFIREQYGEQIITPRLRPVLPWLILLDEEIRRRALEIHPEIAVEEGDPSRLPLLERQRILGDIVRRIVLNEDDRSARDNTAIARIANSDLAEDVHQLIIEYSDNDDAVFFLGRLVWQGEMAGCVDSLMAIAADSTRGVYARIASARAVMACGSTNQKQSLWQKLNNSDAQIPRELLAELIDGAAPDWGSVEQVVIALGKLPPYERFKVSGLSRALHAFVKRLPIGTGQEEIVLFISGLNCYLDKEPYVERRECHVSKEYAWLMTPATHAVERLVAARSEMALGAAATSILLKVPALRFCSGSDFLEHKDELRVLVPRWPELNDALYWASIEQARSAKAAKLSEPLNDDWSISWLGHFWNFNADSLPRLLHYMRSRSLQDDRLVALSTAFRVFVQADSPTHILRSLQDAVAEDSLLKNQLGILLNPAVSETVRRDEKENREYQRKWDEEEKREKQARDSWIAELRSNPGRVRNPPDLKPGELTNDQYWLMLELQDRQSATDRSEHVDWQGLIPAFGRAVAKAYRDASVNHWRNYEPTLRSEGAKGNSVPYSLIFAMAGLEIEATETPEFPCYLDEEQVRHALRYITWELNGFPSWFERMHKVFPDLVEEAVIRELVWELENTGSDESMHYILQDLVNHAPWLHASMAPVILEWMEANPTRINTNRGHCLHILANGGTSPDRLAAHANRQIAEAKDPDNISWWYTLRVDCDPVAGIPEIEKWLAGLDKDTASKAAQIFITALMGDRHTTDGSPKIGRFRTAEHLKSLYVLTHRYIQAKDDINRAGRGAYSPTLRDDAQDARDRLFSLLSEIPGKPSYTFLKLLIDEHPDPDYRPWMAKHAYKRAETDGDLEPWVAEQVCEFDNLQILSPATNRQLFDLAMYRLRDLKNWLERGNDSAWQTWQRVEGETEMRTLIASWLRQQCRDQYTTAQEPELANSQRMDIWLQNTNVRSPVPIELKLLDKGWSGPKLCERLRNQLVGDYLREESAGYGVMLLVWQGRNSKKRWTINGRHVGLSELSSALKLYWQDIAKEFPGVEAIEVVVLDLTIRAQISDS